jgi:hypothetical protein
LGIWKRGCSHLWTKSLLFVKITSPRLSLSSLHTKNRHWRYWSGRSENIVLLWPSLCETMTPAGLWKRMSLCLTGSVPTSRTFWVSPLPRRIMSHGCIVWRKSWAWSPLSHKVCVLSQSMIFLLAMPWDWSHGHSVIIVFTKKDKILATRISFFFTKARASSLRFYNLRT